MGRVFFNTRKNVHALTVAYTVLDSDSGKIFTLDAAAGAYEVTLPTAPVEGFNCKFIVKEDTPTAAITIAAGSAILDGVQKDAGGDAANSTAGTAVSNLVVGTSSTQGDVIDLVSDGVTYYFECLSGINNAITTS
tara:strand:- start:39 stop:443 length:405 start_codon:yes stop_codon:yes gene_type:complete